MQSLSCKMVGFFYFCKMSIIKATEKDYVQLEKLINNAYRGEASKKGWTTEAHLISGEKRIDVDALTMLLKNEAAVILTDQNDGMIDGCVYLENIDNKMYLGMLSVLPEKQADGIGKKLLAASEDYAKSQQCNTIFMHVISVRSELIAWYERRGYKDSGETKPFPNTIEFGKPTAFIEFIVMNKQLTTP